jgi:hypothetical protein
MAYGEHMTDTPQASIPSRPMTAEEEASLPPRRDHRQTDPNRNPDAKIIMWAGQPLLAGELEFMFATIRYKGFPETPVHRVVVTGGDEYQTDVYLAYADEDECPVELLFSAMAPDPGVVNATERMIGWCNSATSGAGGVLIPRNMLDITIHAQSPDDTDVTIPLEDEYFHPKVRYYMHRAVAEWHRWEIEEAGGTI